MVKTATAPLPVGISLTLQALLAELANNPRGMEARDAAGRLASALITAIASARSLPRGLAERRYRAFMPITAASLIAVEAGEAYPEISNWPALVTEELASGLAA